MEYNIFKTDYGNYLSALNKEQLTTEYDHQNGVLSNYNKHEQGRKLKGIYEWLSIFVFLWITNDIFIRGLHHPMEFFLFLISVVGIILFARDYKDRSVCRKRIEEIENEFDTRGIDYMRIRNHL